ncbi:hypothetical protein NQZ68_007123 [Dissostichus eleginoides]|nr:hypothetical protein NQZ68_007123 [Dissostichus eleginoides]
MRGLIEPGWHSLSSFPFFFFPPFPNWMNRELSKQEGDGEEAENHAHGAAKEPHKKLRVTGKRWRRGSNGGAKTEMVKEEEVEEKKLEMVEVAEG